MYDPINFYEEEDGLHRIRAVLLIILAISFLVGVVLLCVGLTQETEVIKFISFAFLGSGGLCFMILISLCDEM